MSAAIVGALFWAWSLDKKARENAQRAIDTSGASASDTDPFAHATASDPYFRSLQGAQEARQRMNTENAKIQKELQ